MNITKMKNNIHTNYYDYYSPLINYVFCFSFISPFRLFSMYRVIMDKCHVYRYENHHWSIPKFAWLNFQLIRIIQTNNIKIINFSIPTFFFVLLTEWVNWALWNNTCIWIIEHFYFIRQLKCWLPFCANRNIKLNRTAIIYDWYFFIQKVK